MPLILLYLVKVSVSLSVVYLFYQFVLRRLTFYNWNRFYLLSYTGLSFLIPFINIAQILERNGIANNQVIRFIPTVGKIGNKLTGQVPATAGGLALSSRDWLIFFIVTGILVMLIRLIIQLASYKKIISKAHLVTDSDVKLYQVSQPIIPFSFGNSIFINPQLHNDDELTEIIRHEFVHVKQMHTVDIILCELLCAMNWYNPFAWMIRKAVRQNLEFIADQKVLQSGVDRKEYQYLLLKVIGNNHFSIASQFNFSSLKKRIAMMNKMKSAKTHLIKFLFLLPLVAILLAAFRNSDNGKLPVKVIHSVIANEKKPVENEVFIRKIIDTIPDEATANNKGYFLDITGNKGNCTVIVKDKNRKEVKRILLTEWNKQSNYYISLYGPLPVEPKDSATEVVSEDNKPVIYEVEDNAAAKELKKLELNDNLLATVTLNNGKTEKYDLNKETDKKAFEKKYGPVISALPKGKRPVQVVKATVVYSNSEVAVVSPSSPTKKSTDLYIANTPGSPTVDDANAEPVESVSPVKDFDNVEGSIILDVKGNMPESRVREMVTELKNKGYDLVISTLEYKNEKIALLKGSISGNGKKQNFEASDFLRFTISDVRKERL